MTWCDFLAFMQTIRGVTDIALGIGLSYLVEVWPKFETLSAMAKRFTIMGACIAIPLLSLALSWGTGCNAHPSGEDVWQAVLAGFLAFGSSQFAHARKLDA